VGLAAVGSGVTDGEGDAVDVPVGDGVPVADAEPAGVVRGVVGVIRGDGLRVVGRGDAVGLRPGEVDCCCVAGELISADWSGLNKT